MNETRQSTEKRFSEAASENTKKRGRPTVYKRNHMEGIGRDLEIFDGRTHRTHVNQYYRAAVFGILEEHKEIPYLEEIFKIGQCLCIQKDEIIEQLGRMYAQDGYSNHRGGGNAGSKILSQRQHRERNSGIFTARQKSKKLGCLMYFGNRFRKGIISDRLKSRSFIIQNFRKEVMPMRVSKSKTIIKD